MDDHGGQIDSQSGRLLTGFLAVAIALLAGAVGFVAWRCIDSVQKQESKAKILPATPENTNLATHRYELIKKEEDKEIDAGNLSPNMAIEGAIAHLEGSEEICSKGEAASYRQDFKEAAGYFTQMLKLIPGEAKNKTLWYASGFRCDQDAFTAYAYEQRSFCYLKLGMYRPAINDLTEAIKLRPGYALNYENRSKAYYLIGEKAKAAADIKAARQVPPPLPTAHYP